MLGKVWIIEATAPKKTLKVAMKLTQKPQKGKTATPKSTSSSGKLTKDKLIEHNRAHEELIAKGLKTPDEIIKYMDGLPAKDKEQIWKQCLIFISKFSSLQSHFIDWLDSHGWTNQ